MQRKNLLIFLVASALFVGGLYLLDKHVFPPAPPPDKKEEVEKPRPKPVAPLPRDRPGRRRARCPRRRRGASR